MALQQKSNIITSVHHMIYTRLFFLEDCGILYIMSIYVNKFYIFIRTYAYAYVRTYDTDTMTEGEKTETDLRQAFSADENGRNRML